MNKEFVPYELALKLRELGFNEECIAYYDLRNDLEFYGGDNLKDTHCVQLNTPLFQQAFRWFREKHDHWQIVMQNTDIDQTYDILPINGIVDYNLFDIFPTYEDAEFACLEKLIEIIETKQQEP